MNVRLLPSRPRDGRAEPSIFAQLPVLRRKANPKHREIAYTRFLIGGAPSQGVSRLGGNGAQGIGFASAGERAFCSRAIGNWPGAIYGARKPFEETLLSLGEVMHGLREGVL